MPEVRSKDELDRPVLTHLRRDFVALRANQTVAAALEHLRCQNLGERVVYFYVVDEDDKLVGVLPTRRLLMGAAEARIDAIMQRGVISVPHSASLLLACELFVMHRLLAFPVVDDNERLLGIVDVSLFTDQVFDLSERQSADDLFQLIGVRLAQSRSQPPWVSFRQRFPWLLCNVVGGIACALIAGLYETFLNSVIVLALFIPIVLTLAESVSMQSMTLTLQAMHQQRIDWPFLARAAGREFLAAGLLGPGPAWWWECSHSSGSRPVSLRSRSAGPFSCQSSRRVCSAWFCRPRCALCVATRESPPARSCSRSPMLRRCSCTSPWRAASCGRGAEAGDLRPRYRAR